MTQNLEAIRRFLLGGIAIFTLLSRKTGERKTFRVRKGEDVEGGGRPHGYYVDLLIGPENTTDYRYLCFLWIDQHGELSIKLNKHGWGEEAFRAFGWLTLEIDKKAQVHFEEFAEFFHAGACSVCGRTLTDPESIDLGIGPVCRGRLA